MMRPSGSSPPVFLQAAPQRRPGSVRRARRDPGSLGGAVLYGRLVEGGRREPLLPAWKPLDADPYLAAPFRWILRFRRGKDRHSKERLAFRAQRVRRPGRDHQHIACFDLLFLP